MNLAAAFLERLARHPERVLLEGDGGVHSRGAVGQRALRVAAALRAAGVRPGDRVVLSLPKNAWLAACHVGALAAGAVVAPVDPAHPDAALAGLVRRAEPALGLADAALAARGLRFAPWLRWWCPGEEPPAGAERLAGEGPRAAGAVPRGADDLALLVFTSGTTGTPKGVPLSHGNLASNLDALARVWEWGEGDRLLHVLPAFHLHGLGVALYGSLRAGNALILHERFDAERVLREAGSAGATLLMAVPTMLHRLVQAAPAGAGRALAGLRAVISGSAPLAPALFASFRERFGLEPVERYGMTETLMSASNPVRGLRKPGSVGPPLAGVQIELHDPASGAAAGRGPGEVWVRGPNVFRGYWRDPEASAAAFADGWFRTGDLGRLDEDGYLFLVGRAKELIVTGGYNVSPVAVEQALGAEGDPRIAELAVAGVADAELGERVVAFAVALDPGEWRAIEASLRARAEERLPRYARPRAYVRVEGLPRNALGKVERARLRDAQATGESA